MEGMNFPPVRFFKVWRDILNFSVERSGPDKLWSLITEYIRGLKKTQREERMCVTEDRYRVNMTHVVNTSVKLRSNQTPLLLDVQV